MSSAIFDALPGFEVPVGTISKSLAKMWTDTADTGGPAPTTEDAKATQVNFVLLLGFGTTAADAIEQFSIVQKFAQRYPSRVVILCPQRDGDGPAELRAKIHGQCFLGKSKGDKRCVEFVLLSYPHSAREHLENQVSICLSTDLPVYYWVHRFTTTARIARYGYLLARAKRVLIDSATAPADALTYPWPNPKALRDLTYSRLLPVRQTVGQFLAAYPPAVLAAGLLRVTVNYSPAFAAEGHVTLSWLTRRIAACGVPESAITFTTVPLAPGETDSLAIQFDYGTGAKFFRWRGNFATGHGHFEADLGSGPTTLDTAASLLSPETALSEAMFF
jgi:glucose-6-phosphate dehydrogenase assembly protein OpcA